MIKDYLCRVGEKALRVFGSISMLCMTQSASASLLQIIHTNDMHSHFEGSQNPALGGYAAVKATIDRIKAEAVAQGIETLVLDAGDFSEGSPFYLADRGEQSWKALDAIGYDAVVIGNHDYLMGPAQMETLVKNVSPFFALLGANFHASKSATPYLYKAMQPRVRLERNGDHVTVMGLTLDDPIYTWRAGKDVIVSPIETARALVPKYRKDSDFVIALTHMGKEYDRTLAYNVPGIDLIVGGHSHDAFDTPIFQPTIDGRLVPIVQAGEHGQYVGSLLVDLVPGKPAQVKRYKLEEVKAQGEKDPAVQNFVRHARERMEAMYPPGYLTQPIGFSEVALELPKTGSSIWGTVLQEGMRLVGKADIAFNSADLYGVEVPSGAITREKLFQFYPRVFEFYNFTSGWTVWTGEVEGYVLKYFLRDAIRQGYNISAAGVTYKVTGAKGQEDVSDILVNGKKPKVLGTYKIAMPEGIARVIANDWYMSRIVYELKDTRASIWAATEIQLKKQGAVVKAPGLASWLKGFGFLKF